MSTISLKFRKLFNKWWVVDFSMIFPSLSFSSKEHRILCYLADHTDHCLAIGIRETAKKRLKY